MSKVSWKSACVRAHVLNGDAAVNLVNFDGELVLDYLNLFCWFVCLLLNVVSTKRHIAEMKNYSHVLADSLELIANVPVVFGLLVLSEHMLERAVKNV